MKIPFYIKGNVSGVYRIRNLVNGKVYIGSSSSSIYARWHNHKSQLKLGKHHSSYFQNAFNKYGVGNFKVKILEVVVKFETETTEQFKIRLLKREQNWLDVYESFCRNKGYNISKFSDSSLGTKRTRKNKVNMSRSLGGKPFLVFKRNKFLGRFDFQQECAEKFNLTRTCISRCLSGSLTQTKGFTFKRAVS